ASGALHAAASLSLSDNGSSLGALFPGAGSSFPSPPAARLASHRSTTTTSAGGLGGGTSSKLKRRGSVHSMLYSGGLGAQSSLADVGSPAGATANSSPPVDIAALLARGVFGVHPSSG